MSEIEFIGKKNVYIPFLEHYPGGLALPQKGIKKIKVTDSEKKNLIRYGYFTEKKKEVKFKDEVML